MKTTLMVEEDMMELFQENIQRTWGKLKGAQSQALKEAMLLWLAHKKQITAITFHDGKQEHITTIEEFLKTLHTNLLTRKKGLQYNATIIGQTETETILSDTLRVLISTLGKPSIMQVNDKAENKSLEEFSEIKESNMAGFVRKLFEWEDSLEGQVELVVEWQDAKLQCVISPQGQIYVGKLCPKLDLQTLLA
ncbi:hypothetical protein [Candidatus Bathycorpusculum sp.]|uniref:hypothetical protein n=1 Tax=Candidatus Bathycorpusculum sp. TaxID=2994959 RepID=UPI00282E72F1|nr:hypothetical protein [Candidatus Termitimicrobium sp.]